MVKFFAGRELPVLDLSFSPKAILKYASNTHHSIYTRKPKFQQNPLPNRTPIASKDTHLCSSTTPTPPVALAKISAMPVSKNPSLSSPFVSPPSMTITGAFGPGT